MKYKLPLLFLNKENHQTKVFDMIKTSKTQHYENPNTWEKVP